MLFFRIIDMFKALDGANGGKGEEQLMAAGWPEGTAQWWWKYVFPGVRERIPELQRYSPFPQPWEPWLAGGPFPDPWRSSAQIGSQRSSPHPQPWRGVVSELLSEVSLKEVADRMPEDDAQNKLRERPTKVN